MRSDFPPPAARLRIHLLAASLLPFCAAAAGKLQRVALDDPHLAIDGAWCVVRTPDRVTIDRHAARILLDPQAGISALAGRKVDVISLALGFDDWYWSSKPLAQCAAAYARLLAAIRKMQPDALVVAITPLASTVDIGQARAAYSLAQLRKLQRECVEQHRQAGDRRMHVLEGETMSNGAMLLDGIHLHVDGAAAYAAALGPMLARLARQHGSLLQPEPAINTSP